MRGSRSLALAPVLVLVVAGGCRSAPSDGPAPVTASATASALAYPVASQGYDASEPFHFLCTDGKLVEGIGLGGIARDSLSWPDGPKDASRAALARRLCASEARIDACVRAAVPDGGKLGPVSFALDVTPGQVRATSGAGATPQLTKCVGEVLASVPIPMQGRLVYTNTADAPLGRFGRKTPGLHVTVRATQSVEALPTEVVERLLRGRSGAIRPCYAAALAGHPGLRGNVLVSFDLDAAGVAKNFKGEPGTIADETLPTCVIKAISSLRFPEPKSNPVRISATFAFESS